MGDGKKRSWLDRLLGRGKRESDPPARGIEIPAQFRHLGEPRRAAAAPEAEPAGGEVDPVQLRQQMLNFLTPAELTAIGAQLGVDVAALPGGKGRKVQGLLQAVTRAEALPALLDACRALKPDVDWQ